MNMSRRSILKHLGTGGTFAALLVSGLMRPITAFAAQWNKPGFESKDMAAAMKNLDAAAAADSKDIVLTAPAIAENGAVVPISVVSNIPNTTRISILVEQNPFPLAGSFELAEGALADVGVRLKFSKTSNVRAVVTAGGKAYMTQKEVKVTAGGCGG
jgi:sulfur-oxidizing protein SoxY